MPCASKKPLKIAITGPPAAGKSTILGLFNASGIPTFSADEEVRKLSRPCQKGFHLVIARFGKAFLGPNGELDRKRLLEKMLRDPRFKKELEEIFHPLVKEHLLNWFQENREKKSIVAEIPLLYQAKWEKLFDKIIWVNTPKEVLLDRLTKRLKDSSLAQELFARYFEDMPSDFIYDLEIEGTLLPEKIKKRLEEHDLL